MIIYKFISHNKIIFQIFLPFDIQDIDLSEQKNSNLWLNLGHFQTNCIPKNIVLENIHVMKPHFKRVSNGFSLTIQYIQDISSEPSLKYVIPSRSLLHNLQSVEVL